MRGFCSVLFCSFLLSGVQCSSLSAASMRVVSTLIGTVWVAALAQGDYPIFTQRYSADPGVCVDLKTHGHTFTSGCVWMCVCVCVKTDKMRSEWNGALAARVTVLQGMCWFQSLQRHYSHFMMMWLGANQTQSHRLNRTKNHRSAAAPLFCFS